jgi:hypothetical protein
VSVAGTSHMRKDGSKCTRKFENISYLRKRFSLFHMSLIGFAFYKKLKEKQCFLILAKNFAKIFVNFSSIFASEFSQKCGNGFCENAKTKISFSTLMKVILCRTSHTRTDGSLSLAAIRRKSAASRLTTSRNQTTDSGSKITFS